MNIELSKEPVNVQGLMPGDFFSRKDTLLDFKEVYCVLFHIENSTRTLVATYSFNEGEKFITPVYLSYLSYPTTDWHFVQNITIANFMEAYNKIKAYKGVGARILCNATCEEIKEDLTEALTLYFPNEKIILGEQPKENIVEQKHPVVEAYKKDGLRKKSKQVVAEFCKATKIVLR